MIFLKFSIKFSRRMGGDHVGYPILRRGSNNFFPVWYNAPDIQAAFCNATCKRLSARASGRSTEAWPLFPI